jgi:uncharacterized protein with PhoU and TrkA domain
MIRWKLFHRDFQSGMSGFREGLISLAEQVNTRVQQTRSSFIATELNASLQSEFVKLGLRVYDLNQVRRSGLLSDREVMEILEKAGDIDRRLEELDALLQQNAQGEITDLLRDFQQALQSSRKVVERWEVGSYSTCAGKALHELIWPEGTFLLVLIRQGKVCSPTDRLHLAPGDSLLVAGPALKLVELKNEMIG